MNYGSTRIDWNAFNFMYSENVRDAFQKLTEQIFCFEFDQPYGIYRYYNQPYIETMPIRHGEDVVGFQSKYFDAATNLSDKKNELIEAITGAHERYPGISKIVFYINKEPGMSTIPQRDKPDYIRRIELHGSSLGIKIEWRGLNQIETMLLSPELEHIRNYFFAVDGGVKKIVAQIQNHSQNIFNSIETDIKYKQKAIKIPREPLEIEKFFECSNQFLLVHGEGGCGKSALIKTQLGEEQEYPVWIFRATDFDSNSLPEFVRKFGDCSWDNLLAAFDNSLRKVCIIDSAEKVFTLEHQETFESAIHALQQHGWKIIITIRTYYKEAFLNGILKTSDILEHQVLSLNSDAIKKLETEHQFLLPADTKLRDLLCNLFYLKLYLSNERFVSSSSPVEFEEQIWSQVICDASKHRNSLNIRRGQMMIQVVHKNANSGSAYYVPEGDADWEAISSLVESGIIQHDETMGGYFVCHDVYEEIVLRHIISRAYNRKESPSAFFQEIGDSLVMRKAFRTWLHSQFDVEAKGIEQFLSAVLKEDEHLLLWKDEILIALLSEEKDAFRSYLGSALKDDEYYLLTRALHLLNTACRVVDDVQFNRFLTEKEVSTYNIYRFTRPSGFGWNYLISFVYEQRDKIIWSNINIALVSNITYAWTKITDSGTTTRNAGLLALYLYKKIDDLYSWRVFGANKSEQIYNTILNSAKEIRSELSDVFETVISEKATGHRELYTKLCEHLLKDCFNAGKICDVDPDLVIRLAELFWLRNKDSDRSWDSGVDLGIHFGLRDHTDHMYYPSSAFQTPTLLLLRASPIKTIDFIVKFFNEATKKYYSSRLNTDYEECGEIELLLPGSGHHKQIVSDRLWKIHRGTSVAPDLLESILMALERWLHQTIEYCSEKIAVDLCVRILSNSCSAALTAVVVNMVLAYPNKLFDIACIFLHTPAIFIWDIHRFTSEHSADFLLGMAPNNQIYDTERINSNALPFRKKRLEEVVFEYQINKFDLSPDEFQARLDSLYKAIDEGFNPEEKLQQAEQFALYRMDMRKMKLVKAKSDAGEEGVALVSDLPENLVQAQEQRRELTKNDDTYLQLDLWSHYRFSGDSKNYERYEKYELNPEVALEDALALLDNPSPLQVDNRVLLYVASVLVIDFSDRLSPEQFSICGEIIICYLQTVIEQQSIHSIGDGTDATIAALPSLVDRVAYKEITEDPAVLLLTLLCDWGHQRDLVIHTIRNRVWNKNPDLAYNLLSLYVLLKPGYDNEVSRHNGISPKMYFERNCSLIESILGQKLEDFPEIKKLSKAALFALNLCLPSNCGSFECKILTESGAILWPEFFDNKTSDIRENRYRDYNLEHCYTEWLAECLLVSEFSCQQEILDSLEKYLGISKNLNGLLTSLIQKQDLIKKPEAFWNIWNTLFEKLKKLYKVEQDSIIRSCEQNADHYYGGEIDEVITTFLFAMPWWKRNIREWHTLRDEDTAFFSEATDAFGYIPGALYSIAFILNSVGYRYEEDGVVWLAKIIRNNSHLRNCELQMNTEYYIEEYMQRLIRSRYAKIKKIPELRKCVLEVLGFLVDRGSTCGFMLRESIS